jgi:hypothetical protein
VIRRRDFLVGWTTLLALPSSAQAQSGTKLLRVGILAAIPLSGPLWVAFRDALGRLVLSTLP